jgi:thiol-disulfide isomerase/thioredoxin
MRRNNLRHQRMRLRLLMSLAAVGGICAIAGLSVPAQTSPTVAASRMKRVEHETLDGVDRTDYDAVREIDLEGLKKILQRDPKDPRPLLINFWATWCDGCREEFPDLVKIDTDYRDKGLNFISITLDDISEIKTTVPEFLKTMKAKMPVVLLNVKDPEPAIHAVDATWDGAMPATYLYDKDGQVVFKCFGVIKPAELRTAIDKQLGSKQ